jgi:hypothetical protein
MIYIGNKKYGRALEFLSLVSWMIQACIRVLHMRAHPIDTLIQAISAPSQAVSLIQLESFKKYVLLSLIHYGKVRRKK